MSVCRFCLANKPRKDITELKVSNGAGRSYTEIMQFCLGTQVENDSKISKKLCVKCFKKTIEFFLFKTLVLKNEAFLKSVNDLSHSSELKVEIPKDKIKTEIETVDVDDVIDNGFESDAKYDEVEMDIKEEPKAEDGSEDELLSVIQKIKYEYIEEKENAPVKKKRIRSKKLKPMKIKITKMKHDMTASPMKVCEECGKYVKDLKAHALTHVPLEQRKRSKCEICEKVFATSQSKSKHKKRKHFGTKKECPICHKMVMNLNMHKKMHNPEELKFECAPCGRRFISKSRLDLHVSVHTKDKPHECEVCKTKFRLKLSMLMHKRSVHDKERSHLCQYCSKRFFKKHHLQIHLRSHTKEKPYTCVTCGKCFMSRTILKNHMLIHSEDKKHVCSLCDMSFVRVGYLNAHMLSHTKEKRFPCQYCGVRFHRSDHRKRHEYTAHLKHASSTPA